MAPSMEARIRMGAAALGIDVQEYGEQVRAGNRWCFRCAAWQPVSAFGPRAGRTGNLDTQCRESARTYARDRQRQKRGYQGRTWTRRTP